METSTKLGRVSIVPRGEYDPSVSYERLDLVRYEGSGYLVLRPVQGVTPADGLDYMLLVLRGQDGLDGQDGKDGLDGLPGKDGQDGLPGKDGEAGSSIAEIKRTGGTGAPGTVDTYTITLTDGSTTSFQVYNGADGTGAGDMTKSVYDPQSKNTDIFAYVDNAVANVDAGAEGLEAHEKDPNAHAEQFAALEAQYRRHVINLRLRDPSKPSYGLDAGDAVAVLDVGPFTGGAEVTAIVSGVEYDAKNVSVNGGNVPDGTLIIRKVEE